jgi:hypothetical protein
MNEFLVRILAETLTILTQIFRYFAQFLQTNSRTAYLIRA